MLTLLCPPPPLFFLACNSESDFLFATIFPNSRWNHLIAYFLTSQSFQFLSKWCTCSLKSLKRITVNKAYLRCQHLMISAYGIFSQFDLVCERGSLGFVSTSVIFAAFFIGGIVVSTISDKFGRKRPLFVCGFISCLFHFVSAFAPAFWVFALFRAVIGFTIGKLHKLFIVLLSLSVPTFLSDSVSSRTENN